MAGATDSGESNIASVANIQILLLQAPCIRNESPRNMAGEYQRVRIAKSAR
jgi:hypothetical protein